MNKKVIYTAVFPHENDMDYFLFEPEIDIDGYDFVCFTKSHLNLFHILKFLSRTN